MDREIAVEGNVLLEELADSVQAGQQVRLTRAGRPIARVVRDETPPKLSPEEAKELMARMREIRKGVSLGPGVTMKDLINEGRKY